MENLLLWSTHLCGLHTELTVPEICSIKSHWPRFVMPPRNMPCGNLSLCLHNLTPLLSYAHKIAITMRDHRSVMATIRQISIALSTYLTESQQICSWKTRPFVFLSSSFSFWMWKLRVFCLSVIDRCFLFFNKVSRILQPNQSWVNCQHVYG